MPKIWNKETAEVPSVKDQPTVEPMDYDESIQAIFNLITFTLLEWQKFEAFHWFDAQEVQGKFGLKSRIDALYMAMTQMKQAQADRSQQLQQQNGWMK